MATAFIPAVTFAYRRLGHDLAKSIVKVRERKAAERIWSDEELASVHNQVDVELWRMAWRGIEC